MKKILLFTFFFSLYFSICHSQWVRQIIPSNINYLYSVDFIDLNTGISCGQSFTGGRALYTTNAGLNWNLANVPDSSRYFYTIKFVSSQMAYMTGGYNNRGAFFRSTDGGRFWTKYSETLPSFRYLFAMDFQDANTGYVGGSANVIPSRTTIFKTINGGLNWVQLFDIDTLSFIDAIKIVNSNTIFAAGRVEIAQKAVVLRTTDGGASWNRTFFNSIRYLLDMDFANASTGVAVGLEDVYRTSDQGESWNHSHFLDNTILNGVTFFPGSGIGIIYGGLLAAEFPFASRTIDYGNTWGQHQMLDSPSVTQGVPFGAKLLSPYNIYVVGIGGGGPAIYHTTNGGSIFVNQISSEIPDSYSLSQNYPNPFNPTTNIEFSLPNKSYVSLKVVDVTGKEISELVNEKLNVGTYRYEFKAEILPSGIYFYKLETENFVETKKMILIK